VRGYSPKVGESTECKTVSAVVSYTHDDGSNYMLILHQAIYIPDMEVNLIFPMQLRDNDIEVNDLPKSMCKHPTTDDHAIIIDYLTITLSIKGIISYFQVSKPTKQQWENTPMENRIALTYESPIWDPHSDRFQSAEKSMMDHKGNLVIREEKEKYILSNFGLDNYDLYIHIPSFSTNGLGGKVSTSELA